MSLLLEALKKAEREKKEAERRASGTSPAPATPSAPVPPSVSAPPRVQSGRAAAPSVPVSPPVHDLPLLEIIEQDGSTLSGGAPPPVTKDQVALSFTDLSLELVEVDASPVAPLESSARKDIVHLGGGTERGGFPALTLGLPGEDLAPQDDAPMILEAPPPAGGFPALIDGVESTTLVEMPLFQEEPVGSASLPILDLDDGGVVPEAAPSPPPVTAFPRLEPDEAEEEATVMTNAPPVSSSPRLEPDEAEAEATVMTNAPPVSSSPRLEPDDAEAEATVMTNAPPVSRRDRAPPTTAPLTEWESESENPTLMSASPAAREPAAALGSPAPPTAVPVEETVITSSSPPSASGESTVMGALRSSAATATSSAKSKAELASLLKQGRRGTGSGSPSQPLQTQPTPAPRSAPPESVPPETAPPAIGNAPLAEEWKRWDHLKNTADFKLNLLVDEEPPPPRPVPVAAPVAVASPPVGGGASPAVPVGRTPPQQGTPQQAGKVLVAAATGVAAKLKERKRILILGGLAASLVLAMGGTWFYLAYGLQGVQQLAKAPPPKPQAKLIQPVEEPPPAAPQEPQIKAGTSDLTPATGAVAAAPAPETPAPQGVQTAQVAPAPASAPPGPEPVKEPQAVQEIASLPKEKPRREPRDDGGEMETRREPPQASEQKRMARLKDGYAAVHMDNPVLAREVYNTVLKEERFNRDAMLGMAAAALREKNRDEASRWYNRLLERDPNDSVAVAGLMGVHGVTEPVAAESRIKNLLRREPDAPHLHFQLGRILAVQSRWSEAQQAFFQAMAGDGENPDYAFNLAVSLEHLGQAEPAVDYYRQALHRAARHPATFDLHQARQRIERLTGAETAPAGGGAP